MSNTQIKSVMGAELVKLRQDLQETREQLNQAEAAYAALREQAQFDLSHPCCQVGFLRAQALLEKAT